MLDCYDQDDLLAYIEDVLAPDEATALRKRLESDPLVAELVEAMRDDRARLVADPEPELPVDFAAQLEPMLVRPMLMEAFGETSSAGLPSRPGRERRRHRHQRQMRTVRRMAVAAAVALVAIGGVWAAYTNVSFAPGETRVATSTETSEQGAKMSQHLRDAIEAWDDDSAIVHHHLPAPLLMNDFELAKSPRRARPSAGTAATTTVVADFVLVVQTTNASAAEQMLAQVAGDLSKPVALVQNFSYDEARRLEQAWLQVDRPERRQSDSIAGTRATGSTERLNQLADRARDQYRKARPSATGELSRQLLGPSDMAATFPQQLDFSSRGATHTITMSVDQLQDLLASLAKAEGHTASLRAFSEDMLTNTTVSFSDRAGVQKSLNELRAMGENALIHLPVKLVQTR